MPKNDKSGNSTKPGFALVAYHPTAGLKFFQRFDTLEEAQANAVPVRDPHKSGDAPPTEYGFLVIECADVIELGETRD